MTTLAGWCTAPAGARKQHKHCRSTTCTCWCHTVAWADRPAITVDPDANRHLLPQVGEVLKIQLPDGDTYARIARVTPVSATEYELHLDPITEDNTA